MGAPRKPTRLKILQGTNRINKHRLNPNEPVPNGDIGDAPDHLSAAEQAIWDEIISIGFPEAMGQSDRVALELLARLIHAMRTRFDELNAAQLARLNVLLGQFGMTPADRARISVQPPKQRSPFDDM